MTEIIETTARVNPFCVISKATFGEYSVHDIQTNSAWGSNPYGEDYATVPDDMVEAVMETCGFLDPMFNEDGTELVSFTVREKPEIPEPEAESSQADKIAALEAKVAEQEAVINALLGEEETV